MADEELSFSNNGHHDPVDILENEMTKRGIINLEKRGDGNILGAQTEAQLGVLQKMATAPGDNDEGYRQALLLTRFISAEEADRAVNALAFIHRYHGDVRPIVDKLLARCAIKGARVEDLKEALTSMRLTTMSSNKDGNRNKSSSPLR